MEPKQEFRDLPHKLTNEERAQVAIDHIKTSDEIAEEKHSRKEEMAKRNLKIKDLEEVHRKQRKAHLTGFEDRQTLCEEVLDLDAGIAYWIRCDSKEVVSEQRKMEADEVKRARQERSKERQGTLHAIAGGKKEEPPKEPERGPYSSPEEPTE